MRNPLEDTGVLDEAAALADDILGFARDSLLTSVCFANRPLAQLPCRVTLEHSGCMTDGNVALFSPSFCLSAFNNSRPLIARAYLHMIVHCLLRHPFPDHDVDMLRWSVAADLSCAAVLRQLECPAIAFEDAERDVVLDAWLPKVEQPTAAAFYALLEQEGLTQEQLVDMEMVIGIDGHELWIDSDDSSEGDKTSAAEMQQQLQERWEQIARATEMDMAQQEQDAPEALTDQLRNLKASYLSLDELLNIYAAPHEQMELSDDEFDYIYYTYGLRELSNIALVEPLEYSETPRVRDFCIAIDTSGSCSGPLVRAFIACACGMLLEAGSLEAITRIWLIQCDDRIQDVRLLKSREDILSCLASFEVKGLGNTDFRPVFERMSEMCERGEVESWEALIYFTDGKGTFPDAAPSFDTAFVFVDQLGEAPQWASKALAFSDELYRYEDTDDRNETS